MHPGPGLNPQAAASTVLGLFGAVLVSENGHFGTSETLPARGGSGWHQNPDDRPEIEFFHLEAHVGIEIHQKTPVGRPSCVCYEAPGVHQGGVYSELYRECYSRVVPFLLLGGYSPQPGPTTGDVAHSTWQFGHVKRAICCQCEALLELLRPTNQRQNRPFGPKYPLVRSSSPKSPEKSSTTHFFLLKPPCTEVRGPGNRKTRQLPILAELKPLSLLMTHFV